MSFLYPASIIVMFAMLSQIWAQSQRIDELERYVHAHCNQVIAPGNYAGTDGESYEGGKS